MSHRPIYSLCRFVYSLTHTCMHPHIYIMHTNIHDVSIHALTMMGPDNTWPGQSVIPGQCCLELDSSISRE